MRTVAVLASRLGRNLAKRWAAVEAIRRTPEIIRQQQAHWLLAPGTAAFPLSDAAASAHAVPRVVVEISRSGSLDRWLGRLAHFKPSAPDVINVFGSPALEEPAVPKTGTEDIRAADRLVAAAADQLLVAHVRPGGGVARLLTWRARHDRDVQQHRIVVDSAAGDSDPASAFAQLGYGRWVVSPPPPAHCSKTVVALTSRPPRWLPGGLSRWLLHWTRAPAGAWPDETEGQYWLRILEGQLETPSALDTLRRILLQRRLIATGRMIREGSPVVSFTAMSLARLLQHRQFRGHRGVWDAEPYGLAVDRLWLAMRGAAPVCYGPAALFAELGSADRSFFQVRFSRLRSGRVIDWAEEQEWRHLGNLDLSALDEQSGFVFVPGRAEARRLASESPWPLLPLEEFQSLATRR
jgi:hypothetical protein